MGLLDFLFKKSKKKGDKMELESSELKKSLGERYEQDSGSEKTVILEKMVSEEPKVYSPAVEHPLLTIQDRISKLEEIYKSLNDKIVVIDGKVATKQDIDDLKAMVHEDLARGGDILAGIEGLGDRLESLRKVRSELTRQVDASRDELTRKVDTLDQIDKEIELLECDQKIIESLKQGDKSTIELSKELGLTRQYIWGRMKALQAGKYVKSVKKGRKTKYKLIKDV